EAENNLIYGVAARLAKATSASATVPWFATIEDEGAIAGAAMWTPPYKLVLTRMSEAAARALAMHVAKKGLRPPAAMAEASTVAAFAGELARHVAIATASGVPQR